MGATTVTAATPSTISGDLGVSPGTSITGTISVGGTTHNNDATAALAQTAAAAADTNMLGQTLTANEGPVLDGLTLVPGVYDIGAGRLNGGVLTLNGPGVYIFRASSDFVSSGSINLINGARACDVFWHVATQATINGSSFVGTIIANSDATGIAIGSGVTLNGRAIATLGSVTMIGDTVSGPTCAAASSSSSSSTSSIPPCIAPLITTVPLIIDSKRISPTSIFISWGPYAGINTFNVEYGLTSGSRPYNVSVTGFSTTINDLPANQPIWVQVAATNNCAIGTYGPPMLTGAPSLPNTGFAPRKNNLQQYILTGIPAFSSFVLKLIQL